MPATQSATQTPYGLKDTNHGRLTKTCSWAILVAATGILAYHQQMPEDALKKFSQKVADWVLSQSATLRKDEADRQAYIKEHGQPPPSALTVVQQRVLQPAADKVYDTAAGEGAAERNRDRGELMRQERELHPNWYSEGPLGVVTRKDPKEIRSIQVTEAIAQLQRAQEIAKKRDRAKAGEQTAEYDRREER